MVDLPSGPVDIQAKLDEWLASNHEAQKYITKLWYVPEGTEPPQGVSHTVRLASREAPDRALTIGMVVKPQYVTVLDMLLAMVATRPPA